MSGLHFAEPQWVHALWVLIAFVGLLIWLDRRGGAALEQLVGLRLQARLIQRTSVLNRRLSLVLFGLAGAFLVLALMRPQWGLRYVSMPRVGAEIMICLDVSRSMLAEDVAPNRLERAKAEIRDLLPYLEGDHVGLIAFAGRATVLSPLTPDFGFLRLVLEGVDVNSTTRGGTRLEEPIRKAVRGFGAAGDVSRAILLITDGEDHDSFPLEAARDAAEAGVRIIAMGFGDEAGSEVMITDPRSGARTLLRDSAGKVVRTRLDGETLREIALLTEGAYVPAGTGVLDLASIYEIHIARLTRGPLAAKGKAVRQEGYQWAVLMGLICLVLSTGVAGRSARAVPSRVPAATRSLAAMLLIAVLVAAAHAGAETSAPAEEQATEAAADPRELYNFALGMLDEGALEQGESKLLDARSAAADDGELRYRATYNLGYSAAQRADALIETEPEEALRQLRVSADWFRESTRLRPESEDPRHNLDVVLHRALILADSLAQRDPSDWAAALEALASQQRSLMAELAGTLEQVGEEESPDAIEGLRREFRGLAATQRTLLSDAEGLAGRVGAERDALQAKAEEERAPEEAIRLVQLENLLYYLHRARERMGHARRQLRQRQAERAYRRASAALAELRRAQDQLRNPVEVLDRVIQQGTETARNSARLAASRGVLPGLDASVEPPRWLTLDYLTEQQQSVEERTRELHARLAAGLSVEGAETAPDEEIAHLLDMVREAEPFVEQGQRGFERAREALEREDLATATTAQREAITALLDARESFLDLRQLIEAAYADEVLIHRLLSPEEKEEAVPLPEILPGLRSLQGKNLGRGERLAKMIEVEQGRIPANPEAEQAEAVEAQRQRLTAAEPVLATTREAMQLAREGLGPLESSPPVAEQLASARRGVDRAKLGFEALRRLFFSIVEHLRETARRQLELNDETQDVAALHANAPAEASARLGPLLPRQQQLAETAGALADALEEQSRQQADAMLDPNTPAQASAETPDMGERLRRAGELVLGAQTDMQSAIGGIEAEPPEPGKAREHQDVALEQLIQAIAELTPPPSQEQQQQDQSAQGEQGESQQAQAQQGEDSSSAESADPAQLLQAVRDRAAQRQRERAKSSGYQPVEKDW